METTTQQESKFRDKSDCEKNIIHILFDFYDLSGMDDKNQAHH